MSKAINYEKVWWIAKTYAMKRSPNEQDAEDFAQEYVMKVFDRNRAKLEWDYVDFVRGKYGLVGSARNSMKNITELNDKIDESTTGSTLSPEEHLLRKERYEFICGMRDLSEQEKVVFKRFVWHGEKIMDIAKQIELTDMRVCQILKNASEKLGKQWWILE